MFHLKKSIFTLVLTTIILLSGGLYTSAFSGNDHHENTKITVTDSTTSREEVSPYTWKLATKAVVAAGKHVVKQAFWDNYASSTKKDEHNYTVNELEIIFDK